VIGMGEQRNGYKLFWEDLMRREYLEETDRCACKSNITADLKKCIVGRVGMIYVAENTDQ